MSLENYSLSALAQELSALRKKDSYHPDMDAAAVFNRYSPGSLQQLMQGMSEITASFYGLLLQQAVALEGPDMAEALSSSLIYTLGKNKAGRIMEMHPLLDRDARGTIEIVIAAIFTASPEFNFEVDSFTATEVAFTIRGTDRYHRISRQLQITHLLKWPVILPFLEGIRDVVAPGWKVATLASAVDENSNCDYVFRIYQEAAAPAEDIQTGMRPPFFRLPAAALVTRGKYLEVDLGPAGDFQDSQFVTMIQQCLSAEAWNACRLYPTGTDQYMLAERFRCMRIGNFLADTSLKAVLHTQEVSKRKRKSIIRILDNRGDMIYQVLFDYYMWNEADFKNKFTFLKSEGKPAPGESLPLPVISRISFDNAWHYMSRLAPVDEIHCLGHFGGYPCVPALFLFRLLHLEAEKWIKDVLGELPETRLVVDSVAVHPSRIMPAGVPYDIVTTVHQLSDNILQFVYDVTQADGPGTRFCCVVLDIRLQR
ncbi:hypothetical protein SAMN04488128_104202 [Chitinophaga eiseniae]|uniref:Uncharacterized protein n=1 Tax=Chitinophaga eiseniae TaxID=634771 RepID=A0A1T4T9B7_9BACT|nr:hypothetical protein [Chitinophaga eiseniae]SKA36973.1 hypothetical protein SAMN04488128_104202 [Chitinophaga eiseniae]